MLVELDFIVGDLSDLPPVTLLPPPAVRAPVSRRDIQAIVDSAHELGIAMARAGHTTGAPSDIASSFKLQVPAHRPLYAPHAPAAGVPPALQAALFAARHPVGLAALAFGPELALAAVAAFRESLAATVNKVFTSTMGRFRRRADDCLPTAVERLLRGPRSLWPVDTGYSKSRFRARRSGPGHIEVSNDAPYAAFLEFSPRSKHRGKARKTLDRHLDDVFAECMDAAVVSFGGWG